MTSMTANLDERKALANTYDLKRIVEVFGRTLGRHKVQMKKSDIEILQFNANECLRQKYLDYWPEVQEFYSELGLPEDEFNYNLEDWMIPLLLRTCWWYDTTQWPGDDDQRNVVTVIVKKTHYIGSVNVVDGVQVHTYLGIPYAQPPVGELRFKKPLPVAEPPKTVDATEWRPACYQNELFKELIINKSLSEDCLHLNVWSPKNDNERQYEADPLRPVLLWIHGGAYISDSASRPIYDARWLAAKSDAVVVTINYRLDILGFFYSGTDEAPGNVGLWDQALAMEWIIDNIAYFGGDPKKITLIGENAGAFSIGVHLLSPISQSLYQNAVMISGSALNYIIGENPEVAKEKWLLVANEMKCIKKDSANNFTEEVMSCLRNKSAADLSKTLLLLSHKAKSEKKKFDEITPQVIFGDAFLPESPETMLTAGDHKRSVNVLIGHTDDEGGYMLPMVDMERYALMNPKSITKDEAEADLKKLTKQLITKTKINADKVAKTYFSSLKSSTDEKILRRTLGVALGDYYITCPTILFGKQLVKSSAADKVNVYHYYWTRKVSDKAVPCADWMGSCHGTDTYMLFGDPFINRDNYEEEDRQMSERFIKTISHFAYHGRPLNQQNKEWPKYYMKDEEVIAPYYEFNGNDDKVDDIVDIVTDNDNNSAKKKKKIFGKNLKTKECEKLWKKYII
ncbi:cholinesterase 1-like [Oppia nitens]|uniref:cholinesterase 1-like n=1 Tax=Oppia nitens TaxID=1686743 RepID=UPI0023DB82CE|nr:cholinesterase 1-like [Oppia nitens]